MVRCGDLTEAQVERIKQDRDRWLARRTSMPVQSDSGDSEADAGIFATPDRADSEEDTKPVHDAYYYDHAIVSYQDVFASLDVCTDESKRGDVYGHGGSGEKVLSRKGDATMVKQWLTALQTWAAIVEDFGASVDTRARSPAPKMPRLSPVVEGAPPDVGLSPGRRLFSKQRAELQPVRRARFCQEPACVYNSASPGQPARADESSYCIWCDPEAMSRTLSNKRQIGHVKTSLNKFRDADVKIYESALAKLPEDFVETSLEHPCQKPGCVFHSQGYGTPRSTTERFCLWCDEAALTKAAEDPKRASKIRQMLCLWEASNKDVYEEAVDKLPEDFDFEGGKDLCRDWACVFSTKAIGHKARRMPGTQWCSWCDVSVVAARETTDRGRAQIAKALSKFASNPAVLSAAWCKLSPMFKAVPQKIKELKRERHAMMAEDLVRGCKGRVVPHITEPAMCSFCRAKPCPISLRTEVKEFEKVAAAHAAAAGEVRVPIETDTDWMRIRFAGFGATVYPLDPDQFTDINPYHCGCLGENNEARCALCFDTLSASAWNNYHYEKIGGCCGKEAPPHTGYYLYSRTGLHPVVLLHRAAEISAMSSNDKYAEQPELTLQQLYRQEEEWRQSRWLTQEKERTRELDAMLCEDYVVFEKIFMVVQLDPVGGHNQVTKLRAFDDLAMALEWLRAPCMKDDAIRRFLKDLAYWENSPERPDRTVLEFKKLPVTGDLMRELWARREESPQWMMLYRKLCTAPWSYFDAQLRLSLGPRTLFTCGETFTAWESQRFPWVEMPLMLQKAINFQRSRIPISKEEQRIQALAWKPTSRG